MRLAQKASPSGSGQIVGGMDLKAQPWNGKNSKDPTKGGYTYNKRNGPASAVAATDPTQQIDRLTGMGMNPQDFFKLAKATGLNPVQEVLKKKSTVDLPTGSQAAKERKKKEKKKKKRGGAQGEEDEEEDGEEPAKKGRKAEAGQDEEEEEEETEEMKMLKQMGLPTGFG
mmetsp:Transcript_36980/g.50610  ORF Transcript_36980/g.50610 Transcript_36980/m.50610 type:complete len:170 (-) Transcript_36980:177-686(-)